MQFLVLLLSRFSCLQQIDYAMSTCSFCIYLLSVVDLSVYVHQCWVFLGCFVLFCFTKFGNLWQVCLLRLQHSFNSETVLPTECSYLTIWISNHNQNPFEIEHKTRNQLQEKKRGKKNDFMDIKRHATKIRGLGGGKWENQNRI